MERSSSLLKIGVVIVNYKNSSDTIACLSSLIATNYSNQVIYLIDNFSNDGSVDRICRWLIENSYSGVEKSDSKGCKIQEWKSDDKPPIVLMESSKNGGFAFGCNLGTKHCLLSENTDFIWLLNNDTEVEIDVFEKINNFYFRHGYKVFGTMLRFWHDKILIQALGGKYNKYFGLVKHIGAYEEDLGQYKEFSCENEGIDYLIGASMLVSRDVFLSVGLLEESYFLYFEELDFFSRLKGKYSFGIATEAIVYHKEGGTINGSKHKSFIGDYYGMLNRIMFTRKFYPKYILTVKLALFYSLLKRILIGQFGRAKMILGFVFKR